MFSRSEVSLLRRHYPYYITIEAGKKPPTTEAQKHFFAVTRGETLPTTAHEVAYMKYKAWCMLVESLKRARDLRRNEKWERQRMEMDKRVAEDLARDAQREARLSKPKPKPSPAVLALGNQILAEQQKQVRE